MRTETEIQQRLSDEKDLLANMPNHICALAGQAVMADTPLIRAISCAQRITALI